MKRGFILAWLFVLASVGGCSLGPATVLDPKRPSKDRIPAMVSRESEGVAQENATILEGVEKRAAEKAPLEPIMPVYDPLEDHKVSFSMVDEDLRLILYALSQSVGMNLILDPGLGQEKKLVTLHFEKVPASTVLREVLGTFDLYYEIEKNVIRVRPYQERLFRLNFLDTNVSLAFDVGGDVLGASQTESAAGLSGSFKVSGKGSAKGNAYDILEQMLQKIVSKGGAYSLNRLSGTLYVKDTPGVITTVSSLVNHLRDIMAREILIEARIVEVVLADEYSYGIDWSILRGEISGATKINSASWALGRGLVLSGVHKAFSVDVTLDALRTFGDAKIVSNPSIRAKHGHPSIISVGTSITYKKTVSTTTTSTVTDIQESTDVEVSTVFDGLILGLVPFIEEDGSITLLINPIKSDVDPESIEPVKVSDRSDESISLPKVSIKEMSTTIGVRSGNVILLGGLIDKHRHDIKKGVPILSAIPVLGYLFKNENMRDEIRELVIVLSVTMV